MSTYFYDSQAVFLRIYIASLSFKWSGVMILENSKKLVKADDNFTKS